MLRLGTPLLQGLPASLGATRGGARESEAWNAGWEAGFPTPGSGRGVPQCGGPVGAARRGAGPACERQGRWRLSAPPRSAPVPEQEAVAVGGFAGLCGGDFGSGAAGTSAGELRAPGRAFGGKRARVDGSVPLSMRAPADRPAETQGRASGAGQGWVGARLRPWVGGPALAGVQGLGVGAALGDLGSAGRGVEDRAARPEE